MLFGRGSIYQGVGQKIEKRMFFAAPRKMFEHFFWKFVNKNAIKSDFLGWTWWLYFENFDKLHWDYFAAPKAPRIFLTP